MTNDFANHSYRSPKTLSFLASGFLGGVLLCNVLFIIFSIGMLVFPDRAMSLGAGEQAPVAFVLIGLVSILHALLYIPTIVFFLVWLHRAYKNLSALRASYLEYTPGWAVGWWFIPFANLVKPYQVMTELWSASDPDFDAEAQFVSNTIGSPAFIGLWWALFIVSNISLRISDNMSDGDMSAVGGAFAVVFIIANVIRGIDAFLAIKIVRDITAREELRFKRLGNLNSFGEPPPPPPIFN